MPSCGNSSLLPVLGSKRKNDKRVGLRRSYRHKFEGGRAHCRLPIPSCCNTSRGGPPATEARITRRGDAGSPKRGQISKSIVELSGARRGSDVSAFPPISKSGAL